MPIVNIRITDENVTREQKKIIIAGVTDILQKTLGKNPATTMVIIDEVQLDDVGLGGLGVREYRQNMLQEKQAG